jgi:hypothetical protein
MRYVVHEYVENFAWNVGLYFKYYEIGDIKNLFGCVTSIGLWEIIPNTSYIHPLFLKLFICNYFFLCIK